MVLHEDHRQQAHVRFALIDGGRARVVRAIAPPLADSLFFHARVRVAPPSHARGDPELSLDYGNKTNTLVIDL